MCFLLKSGASFVLTRHVSLLTMLSECSQNSHCLKDGTKIEVFLYPCKIFAIFYKQK